jgi:hypothetical protein
MRCTLTAIQVAKETVMLLAIESLIKVFERLIIEAPARRAHNDNDDISEDDRRCGTYR